MRRLILSAAIAIAACALASCGTDDASSPDRSARSATELVGPQWVLDTAALAISGADDVTSTISFDAARVSGNDGCNQFGGSYTAEGSKLTFGPLAGTQMACPGPAGEVGQRVTAALGDVASYGVSGATLTLRDAGGASVLRYRESTPGVGGAWNVVSVLYDDAIRSVVTGTTLTAVFGADGQLTGSAGCNTFHGSYAVKGASLQIGPLAATRKACREPKGITEQEHGYLAALQSVVRFEQSGDQLTLLNAKDQMAVILKR